MPNRCIQVGLYDLVNHAELIAKLTVSAGLIQHTKSILPEPATHRENRIVMCKVPDIILAVPNVSTGKMTRYFSEVGLHDLFNRRNRIRFLGQDHLSNDRINIGVR